MPARFVRTFLCLMLTLSAVPALAQQLGSINGKITDSSGAVLPGVTVDATSNVLPSPRTAVTGPDGVYQLPALPPGTYTIEAWHEKMGTQEQKVTIGAKETKDVAFTFKAPADAAAASD